MSLDILTAALRATHVGASLFLFGALAFELYGGAQSPSRRIEAWLSSVVFATGALWLGALAQTIGGASLWRDPQLLFSILFQTSFGPWWLAHIALSGLMLALYVFGLTRRWRAGLGVMALQIASLSWIGHSASLEGVAGFALMAAHALHLYSAGAWMGGALALGVRLRGIGDETDAQALLRRFSRAGYVFVAVLAVAGCVNLRLVTHNWLPDAETAYGFTMALKLGLATGLLVVAAYNRFYASSFGRRALILRGIVLEHVLFLGILMAAATLAGLEPNGHH